MAFSLFVAYALFRAIIGQSIDFYYNTGLRMPLGAKLVAEKSVDYSDSPAEGCWVKVFAVTQAQMSDFLKRVPWGKPNWHKGPVPYKVTEGAPAMSPTFDSIWGSKRVWYAAEVDSSDQDKDIYGAIVLILDPVANRVYLLGWKM